VMQLLALGVQRIVAKAVAHRPTLPTTSEHRVSPDMPWTAAPRGSPTPSSQAPPALIVSQETLQNTLKIPRICPERVMFSRLQRRIFLPCMLLATRRSRHRETMHNSEPVT
jgi:hypothetical protein